MFFSKLVILYFFEKNFENALVNPANPYVLLSHLLCASWELPLSNNDEKFFGCNMNKEKEELTKKNMLRERHKRWYLSPAISYPAQNVNIRSSSSEDIAIVITSSGALLETIESTRAIFQVHSGAIYLHQGEQYLVTSLDLTNHIAYVEPANVPYYTQDKDFTDLRILRETQEKDYGDTKVYLGEVEVTTTVVGYKKKQQYTEAVIGEEPLELPPQHFPTIAVWFDLTKVAETKLAKDQLDLAGGLHALEHAAISILPLFALCDRNDIGGVSTTLHPDTGQPQIFIYDAHPGGVGIAEKGFELIDKLWIATLRVIKECPCEEGCPSCIQSPKCGNNNKPLDKQAAILLLEELLYNTGKGL